MGSAPEEEGLADLLFPGAVDRVQHLEAANRERRRLFHRGVSRGAMGDSVRMTTNGA